MTKKLKFKRLPKSQRAHIRQMKQLAHKDGVPYNPGHIRRAPATPRGKAQHGGQGPNHKGNA